MRSKTLFRPPVSTLRLATAVLALAALAAAGCSSNATARRTLTQRERDSTLGASVLPGAGVVTRALKESDRASARAATLDSQADSDAP